jgi:hypothetical protein
MKTAYINKIEATGINLGGFSEAVPLRLIELAVQNRS